MIMIMINTECLFTLWSANICFRLYGDRLQWDARSKTWNVHIKNVKHDDVVQLQLLQVKIEIFIFKLHQIYLKYFD